MQENKNGKNKDDQVFSPEEKKEEIKRESKFNKNNIKVILKEILFLLIALAVIFLLGTLHSKKSTNSTVYQSACCTCSCSSERQNK